MSKHVTNWDICSLCQTKDRDRLVDPRNNPIQEHRGKGYTSLANTLKTLSELNSLSFGINIDRLDNGSGIEETLKSNHAKWHTRCVVHCIDVLKRESKRKYDNDESRSPVKKRLRKTNVKCDASEVNKQCLCYICEEVITENHVAHDASTWTVNATLTSMAMATGNTKLLAKLSDGDMHAQDARYHKSCMTIMYNQYKKASMHTEQKEYLDCNVSPEPRALAELVSFVEEKRATDPAHVFLLSELTKKYKQFLLDDGASTISEQYVHPTRLKERLQAQVPGLEDHKGKYLIAYPYRRRPGVHFTKKYSS